MSRLARLACFVLLTAASAPAQELADGDAYGRIEADRIVLGNSLVERVWTKSPFRTEAALDKRSAVAWSEQSDDFSLTIDGVDLSSSVFGVTGALLETLPRGGIRLTLTLRPLGLVLPAGVPHGIVVTRVAEVYPGVAGFRLETSVESPVSLPVSGYTVDRLDPGFAAAAEIHSFRAGADWREPGWPGPSLAVGDPQPGTWRVSRSAGPAQAVEGTAQWMSLESADGATAFFVLERNDYSSSQMSFDGSAARARVDLSRDVVYAGPFEESVHAGNPAPGPARHRVVLPGRPLRLEPVFTGFGASRDDEPWQHFRYLEGHRMPPYRRDVVFNTNGVDANRISTGAKDDMDLAEVERQAAVARDLGVETFVLDDGWQARSGDWCPDSPACPEPRWDGDPQSKFRPRFPDASFAAVRSAVGDMSLGLWMSPMHFNPSSQAWAENPQWACLPVSLGLVAVNLADPDSGSNEAGIGTWNPEARAADGTRLVDHVEARIRKAIDEWEVRYFKFDFLVWLDCAGVDPVDAYGYRESFMAMLDRLIRDHPEVTFQIDETNDYRLFPFEAIARGPTWYQNGSPRPREGLHASWILAPWIPPFALGRNALRNGLWDEHSVDFIMAAALPSHLTFFNDLTVIPPSVVERVHTWTDYYRAHRADLATFTYPLLDDPIGAGWTALQPWNPETGRGFLLVYRLDSDADRAIVPLRNVPPGRTFRLFEAPDDTPGPERTSAELSAGIEIVIPTRDTARVIRIEAAEP